MDTKEYYGKYIDMSISKKEAKELTSNYDYTGFISSKGRAGIYLLYDRDCNLLYIGWSNSVSSRIHNHFRGTTNTSWFAHLVDYADIVFCESLDRLRGDKKVEKGVDIEKLFIEELTPPCNRVSATGGYRKKVLSALLHSQFKG